MSLDPAQPAGRLRALLCYLLPAPLRWLLLRRDVRPAVARAFAQSTGLTLLLQLLIGGFVLIFAGATVLLHIPATNGTMPWANWFLPVLSLVLLTSWGVLWVLAAVLAAFGSARRLPLVARLGHMPRRRTVAFSVATAGYLFLAVVTALTVHAATLTRPRSAKPARVYVLYDHHATTIGTTPRWLMSLGVYRIARSARDRWGPGQVVVDRVSLDSLREAFLHGEVVILATHGKGGKVHYDRTKAFTASQLGRQVRPGPRLKLVYITACGGGHAHARWQRGLRPAKVISFARDSSTSEHAWWLWMRAPQLL